MKKKSKKGEEEEQRPNAYGFKIKHFISYLSNIEEFNDPKI
jgi:hypothetical protein